MTARHVIDSPIGPLGLVADAAGRALAAVEFDAGPPSSTPAPAGVLADAASQLAEYFRGERREFTVPLEPAGTEFQQRVWGELRAIAYGATDTYGAIAGRLGLTGHGARAVGAANGANPIPVIVQCHRVVGASGRLTGYAGGLERKRALLALEGATLV